MNRVTTFKVKNQDCVLSPNETSSTKGGLREFIKKGTGNPVNHQRYWLACMYAESVMLVTLHDGEYFCVDW